MAFAALIFLPEKGQGGDEVISVLGLPVPVYQARHAAKAGCKHVVLYAPHMGRAELHFVETMKDDGLSVGVARNPAELASAFHPDERIALFAPGRIARQDLLSSLLKKNDVIVSVLPAIEVDSAYRIDAQHAWAGLAVVPASITRMAGELPGDWAGELALLRIAIQHGAIRTLVEPNDVIDLADTVRRGDFPDDTVRLHQSGALLDALDNRFSRGLSFVCIMLGKKAVIPAHLALLAVVLLAGACLLGWLRMPVTALLAAGIGLCVALLADQLAALRLESNKWSHWLTNGAKLVSGGLILLLGVQAMQADGQWGNVALALWLLVQIITTGVRHNAATMLVLIAGVAAISAIASPAWSFAVALLALYGDALRQLWSGKFP